MSRDYARRELGPQLFATPVQSRESDERYTPPEVFDALGVTFDLDAAAPPGGVAWIPASSYYSAADDGLARPWFGLVWLNPPFSNVAPWAARFTEHANGVALVPFNVNASWLYRLLRAVPAVLVLEHVAFVSPTHTGRHVPVMVGLVGLGAGVPAIERAAGRLRGVLLRPDAA